MKKGFHPRWSAEQFQIRAVKPGAPPLYYLRDYDGEPVEGAFYEAELQLVADPSFFPVEKVLKRRTVKGVKQALVKFMGYKEPVGMAASWRMCEGCRGNKKSDSRARARKFSQLQGSSSSAAPFASSYSKWATQRL